MVDYQKLATRARRRVLGMIHSAQTSHIGSNLSCIDILAVLYGKIANVDSELREDRDRILFSKGWAAAAAYFFLAEKGIIPEKSLETYCKPGSALIGLVERSVRGIEAGTGSMGHGLPLGVGMALGAKRSGELWKTYVLLSDGEMNCGTTWESALIASHHKLDNLFAIIDYNKWQAIGRTNEVLNLEPLGDKWRAFGWEVREIDGHDFVAIENALSMPPSSAGVPVVVIAHTIKGKGVSFMEDKLIYHYKSVSNEEYELALKELSYA
ncbi:MAG: hypothetical protein A3D65_03175 [Candidatus Lloydbacteria bacterium RIFCSPHIGHO2_02_FULL_50_13]|uniref:Transketolase N-terminal domain-containing protein n=1 Tax=Candidatus Lloydbacteria bacterium RIFCSPHIGHO2_02_FULL_50_13 TaxID=1798661 RepID=A0A1G2D564_9BACT|nr:MAG: hypothetical protein A3D65_03175 [Candidatus Lloydbacteria bacterium RIFCSPHIGHO2_02_FULL_50_13]